MIPTQKSSGLFVCECCNYSTSRKSQYQRHLETDKHTILQNPTSKKFQPEKLYTCDCGKTYKHSSTLYAHKKKCNQEQENQKEKPDDKNDKLIEYLIKENSELRKEQTDIKQLILELVKNGTMNNSHNTTHTNSHNKAFNLQFFLNETCKNAMNINEFVDSIKLQLSDLMQVGELGYVEGISKIIVKNLNNLDETIRPVHCTDKKRETMYVKDEGQWMKEDENKTRLKKAIIRVSNKNIKLLPEFREKYPEYRNSSSKISDVHDKLVIEVMETDNDKKEKIIKNISKVTTIRDNH
jgi:hypothetical protein